MFLLEHITALPSDHSFNIYLMHHLFASEIGRQNTFSTPRQSSWDGKCHIDSLYECTFSQKLSVLLVSQACCFIMGQLDYGFPWDKISYGKDCGQRYSLFSYSLQEQWQLEWSCFGEEFYSFCSFMNTFLKNLKAFISSIVLFCMGCRLWSNFLWNP